jgi:hypothetical protein
MVVWVCLMIVWLLFGGYTVYSATDRFIAFGHLIPWACVLILGLDKYRDGK